MTFLEVQPRPRRVVRQVGSDGALLTECRLLENGILRVDHAPGTHVREPEALEILHLCIEVTQGTVTPVLVDIRRLGSIDRAARRIFSHSTMASRLALLLGSPTSRVIGNFFMGLGRMSIPTRLFTDEAAAVAWLVQEAA